jgi:hypothetical protein
MNFLVLETPVAEKALRSVVVYARTRRPQSSSTDT